MPLRPCLQILALILALAPARAGAEAWSLDDERSTFAVLTHRAGVGARLAHDHLIVARAPAVEIEFDRFDPASAKIRFNLPTLALEVDPAAERAGLAERLAALGALDGDLPPIDDDDRAKIRKAMLGARQLFAERFPEIRAGLSGLERRGGDESGRVAPGWSATLSLELRGERVEVVVPLRWSEEEGELSGEFLAELRFSDFRIEPYSALLGAIRNDDLFHVYARVVARPAGAGD